MHSAYSYAHKAVARYRSAAGAKRSMMRLAMQEHCAPPQTIFAVVGSTAKDVSLGRPDVAHSIEES
jgi:hypothetical protein